MKNFIKRITDRIRRKPLLVKPDVSVSLLTEFAEYILHNANWSESYADKPWYSEVLDKNVNSKELAELFLNSR